jgi:hypothetical protein
MSLSEGGAGDEIDENALWGVISNSDMTLCANGLSMPSPVPPQPPTQRRLPTQSLYRQLTLATWQAEFGKFGNDVPGWPTVVIPASVTSDDHANIFFTNSLSTKKSHTVAIGGT